MSSKESGGGVSFLGRGGRVWAATAEKLISRGEEKSSSLGVIRIVLGGGGKGGGRGRDISPPPAPGKKGGEARLSSSFFSYHKGKNRPFASRGGKKKDVRTDDLGGGKKGGGLKEINTTSKMS